MQRPGDAVAIACLALFGIILTLVICVRFQLFCLNGRPSFARKKQADRQVPKSILRALTLLEGVTEKPPRGDVEVETDQPECPICLGRLYPNHEEASAVDLEAGHGVTRPETAATTTTATTATAASEGVQRPPAAAAAVAVATAAPEAEEKRHSALQQPIRDEVIEMKRCRHRFHARCLATWFLRRKYDCPVCRTPYYQEPEAMEPDVDYRHQYQYQSPTVVLPVPFW
ncbi:hypothetical protein GGR56DRAFT_654398 [Xylariaceae sp. FL0804]|nr:hypothetical protein GGR56DRAFT_654398 [Xylariaceae sp. FL0804]